MSDPKRRTLFYRRAAWHKHPAKNLEHSLHSAHKMLSTTQLRSFPHNGGEIQGLAWDKNPNGLLIHVAAYVPNQPTSLVPFPSKASIRDTSPEPPPPDHNFLEGDIFFLVNENHILMCPSGARESTAISFIDHMLRRSQQEFLTAQFTIEPVANIDKISLLQNEGVKKISLNSTVFDATTKYKDRTTTRKTLLNSMAKEFVAMFSDDVNKSIQEVDELENLSVKIEISFDSRKKGGSLGKDYLGTAASRLIDEKESDGFTIVTGGGNKLTSEQIRINKPFTLESFGNSISRESAWSTLALYYYELKESGTLNQ